MTPDEFATITRRIIDEQGFEGFLPTACFPERQQIRVLEGVPAAADPEQVSLEWAADLAEPGEEYLIAFKADVGRFKVVRFAPDEHEEESYEVDNR